MGGCGGAEGGPALGRAASGPGPVWRENGIRGFGAVRHA